MGKGKYNSINGVYKRLKNDINWIDTENPTNINVIALYAHNGSGKTRVSKNFQDVSDEQILCYNAFFEDYFYWDNENNLFKIHKTSWVFDIIKDHGLNNKIVDNFKEITGTVIEPDIDIATGNILFKIPCNYAANQIKISRGEESIFVWSIFYTIIELAVQLLNESEDDRSTSIFNNVKHIIIDDPVSSMDDTRIITIALKVTEIILKSGDKFNYLITTHHALFFNVLFHKNKDTWNKKNYILSKTENTFKLKKQPTESPFAYHHTVISEIQRAINDNNLKKYHFNLFRTLLEKTANFVGNNDWKKCLDGIPTNEDFLKVIDHYSHDRLSDLEYSNLLDAQIKTYENVFTAFLVKYNFVEVLHG